MAPPANNPTAQCLDRFVFVDDTRSITGPDDHKRWLDEALAYVDQIAACDTLSVLWIDDATRTAAPLVSVGGAGAIGDDATLDERMQSERKLTDARQQASEAVRRALERRSKAQTTDVISAFARITPRPGHHSEIVLFTDALNETAEIDLANKRLPPIGDALTALATGIVTKRGWQPGMLAETNVYFLLSSTETGQRAPRNSAEALEAFYKALLSRLGAQVVHFGNHPAFSRNVTRS